jgi:hypothetical protein
MRTRAREMVKIAARATKVAILRDKPFRYQIGNAQNLYFYARPSQKQDTTVRSVRQSLADCGSAAWCRKTVTLPHFTRGCAETASGLSPTKLPHGVWSSY